MKIWETKTPGTLWATPDLLRDCFTTLMCCFCFGLSDELRLKILLGFCRVEVDSIFHYAKSIVGFESTFHFALFYADVP